MRYADAAMLLALLLIGWSFYRAHRNPNFTFNAFDLIMENGRVSRLACAFMATLAVTSWIMIRLTFDQKMTEGYMTSYGLMWVAPIIAKLFSPPSNTATSTSTTSTTSSSTP